MTELDHAPAETTAETTDQPPSGEQRPGSGDQTRYPSGVTDADTNPSYYDGDIKAALAADTTPTRQQAARDDASDHQAPDDTTTESPDAPASGHDPDIEAILHENDNLPEPRTRQEAAREDPDGQAATESHDPPASGHDPDIEAILHENDNLPEPRTRQEAARNIQPHERDAGEWPSPEERERFHETYLEWRNEIPGPEQGTGWEQGTCVVGHKPDRSPGDRSDLPPTGEELLDMESDSASRFERLRGHLYKEADDITDVAEKAGNRALELFDHPPTETHTEVPSGHPEITNQAPPAVEGGQLVLAGLMVGMLGYELSRAVKNRVDAWRGR